MDEFPRLLAHGISGRRSWATGEYKYLQVITEKRLGGPHRMCHVKWKTSQSLPLEKPKEPPASWRLWDLWAHQTTIEIFGTANLKPGVHIKLGSDSLALHLLHGTSWKWKKSSKGPCHPLPCESECTVGFLTLDVARCRTSFIVRSSSP